MLSHITGFITIPDKEIETVITPNGKVDFVEFIGATDAELLTLRNKKIIEDSDCIKIDVLEIEELLKEG